MDQRDVFLCHAHADKETYVRPLAAELRKFGVSFWLDEAEVRVGDYITNKVSEGLRRSKYVVVFITYEFLLHPWAQLELGSALNREASTREIVVLPILIAPQEVIDERFPLLRDKLHLQWSHNVSTIAAAIAERVGPTVSGDWTHFYPVEYTGPVWVRFLPSGANLGREHQYRIRWGPWECKGRFTSEYGAVCLVTTKGHDEIEVPLFVTVSPLCNVSVGIGSSPCERSIDINHDWYWASPR